MKAHGLSKISVKEYIQEEIETKRKYEYHNGSIYALAGGTINHGLLCGNIYSEIKREIEGNKSKCIPFTSEVKLYIAKSKDSKSFVYPDSMVICGEIEQSDEDKNSVTNPVLIAEVLSKSTAGYDREDKFHLYTNIPGFKEYILIEQEKYVVDVHYKPDHSDLWRIIRYEGLDARIKLESLNIEISIKRLYAHVKI